MTYKYKNIYKNIFIIRYEQFNNIYNNKKTFKKIKKLKTYIVDFKKKIIKFKLYLFNSIIKKFFIIQILGLFIINEYFLLVIKFQILKPKKNTLL